MTRSLLEVSKKRWCGSVASSAIQALFGEYMEWMILWTGASDYLIPCCTQRKGENIDETVAESWHRQGCEVFFIHSAGVVEFETDSTNQEYNPSRTNEDSCTVNRTEATLYPRVGFYSATQKYGCQDVLVRGNHRAYHVLLKPALFATSTYTSAKTCTSDGNRRDHRVWDLRFLVSGKTLCSLIYHKFELGYWNGFSIRWASFKQRVTETTL